MKTKIDITKVKTLRNGIKVEQLQYVSTPILLIKGSYNGYTTYWQEDGTLHKKYPELDLIESNQ